MKFKHLLIVAVLVATATSVWAQETPKSMAATYDELAKVILSLKQTERNFVRAILDGHFRHAEASFKRDDYRLAAAEIALFANEGDNAVAGVRKRLVEGGHHHHADGEAKGIFEPGFVIVTKKAKQEALEASAALRRAGTAEERNRIWKQFASLAESLLSEE